MTVTKKFYSIDNRASITRKSFYCIDSSVSDEKSFKAFIELKKVLWHCQ
jgi:hypothetical protein